jgi:hypothetical protein
MIISNERASRLLIFGVITTLSLFLLGARNITGTDVPGKSENQQITEIVSVLAEQLPEQYRASWSSAAERNPKLLLAVSTEKFACSEY